jgi:hypothetical protein
MVGTPLDDLAKDSGGDVRERNNFIFRFFVACTEVREKGF